MPCDELCSQQEALDPGHYLQLTAAPEVGLHHDSLVVLPVEA